MIIIGHAATRATRTERGSTGSVTASPAPGLKSGTGTAECATVRMMEQWSYQFCISIKMAIAGPTFGGTLGIDDGLLDWWTHY